MENNSEQIGEIYFGEVNETTIGYVLKYLEKGRAARLKKGRNPEFSIMSKGLGSDYLTQNMVNYHHSNPAEKAYITGKNGKKLSMPRYYKDKIFDENQKNLIALKMKVVSTSKTSLSEKQKIEIINRTNQNIEKRSKKRKDL